MNKDLLIKNAEIRKKRPTLPDDNLHTVFEDHGTIQLAFQSNGCSYSKAGSCIMCDYYSGRNISPVELDNIFDKLILNSEKEINTLILNSCGSILDEKEISKECFEHLLKKLKSTNIKNIIFETHYLTITKDKLEKISKYLNDRLITFEMGLESSNPSIRENNLLKNISNEEVIKIIDLIHSYKMKTAFNLLIGIPFLTPKQQLDDVLNSINWCFKNGTDEIDLFPINIKPYTLLYELYQNGEYKEISHWLVIEILNRVSDYYLSKIYLAWYGNRETNYKNGEINIIPKSCPNCNDDIMNFYKNFLSCNETYYRRNLIDSIIYNTSCDCYKNMLKSLEKNKQKELR